MKADFEQLFLLGTGHVRGALHVAPVTDVPNPFEVFRGERPCPPGLRFRRMKGSRPVDVVGTTLPPLRLVSPRLVEVLLADGTTGWHAEPVQVEPGSSEELPGYSLLIVDGRSGPVDDSLSERAVLPPPRGGRTMPGWKGLLFNPNSWDGSDVFTPSGAGYLCVTARVKELFEREDLTNASFTSLAGVERLML